MFEWHFTVRGPRDSDFDGGFYHGRIVLPPEYPMRPPSIMLLTVSIESEDYYLQYADIVSMMNVKYHSCMHPFVEFSNFDPS